MSAAKESDSAIDVVEMTVERAQAGFASGAFTSESLTKAFSIASLSTTRPTTRSCS